MITIRSTETTILPDAEAVIHYLKKELNIYSNNNTSFIISSINKSPYATYYTTHQYFKGIKIYNSQVKVCVNRSNNKKFISGAIANTKKWDQYSGTIQKKKIPSYIAGLYHMQPELISDIQYFVNENGEHHIMYLFSEIKNDKSKFSIALDENNNILFSDEHKYYFSDSTVTGKVFLPDPLTTANTTYGGSYADNDDEDNDELNDERSPVNFIADFESGVFYLRNENIELKDFASPSIPVINIGIPVFDFTRNENAFEDVNTFFHITNFSNYISSLGYDSLQDLYIEIDTHGASGADQSFFATGTTLTIQYGEGGVDDAEDADVIIHEYGHALSYNAAPESNSGFERRAIDEGYCDYFAVSYSRGYSDFNWQNVFSWDGHNEFWSGRNADSDKHYPEDIIGDFYAGSEIWSGALMDIFDAIGKENTDKLVFESLYGNVANMDMPDAAQVLLNAEELLFTGTYYEVIFNILYERGLLLGIAIQEESNASAIQIINTFNYTTGDDPLIIKLNEKQNCRITITDLSGKMVYENAFHEETIQLKPDLAAAGIYIITIQTENTIRFEKIFNH
ncbi:MAG: T9SS type A sorting domain-containing protein [Fimbriimonadaceae bacterium]|nr:T9SS type A sorting domain-containing protein [Chitinophagales bacterium]